MIAPSIISPNKIKENVIITPIDNALNDLHKLNTQKEQILDYPKIDVEKERKSMYLLDPYNINININTKREDTTKKKYCKDFHPAYQNPKMDNNEIVSRSIKDPNVNSKITNKEKEIANKVIEKNGSESETLSSLAKSVVDILDEFEIDKDKAADSEQLICFLMTPRIVTYIDPQNNIKKDYILKLVPSNLTYEYSQEHYYLEWEDLINREVVGKIDIVKIIYIRSYQKCFKIFMKKSISGKNEYSFECESENICEKYVNALNYYSEKIKSEFEAIDNSITENNKNPN